MYCNEHKKGGEVVEWKSVQLTRSTGSVEWMELGAVQHKTSVFLFYYYYYYWNKNENKKKNSSEHTAQKCVEFPFANVFSNFFYDIYWHL